VAKHMCPLPFLQEAEVLEACVHHLVKQCGLQPGQLGVISPYAAQVSLLSKKLQKAGMRVNGSGSGDSQDGEQLMPSWRIVCASRLHVCNGQFLRLSSTLFFNCCVAGCCDVFLLQTSTCPLTWRSSQWMATRGVRRTSSCSALSGPTAARR
jgi:hypothetical protein